MNPEKRKRTKAAQNSAWSNFWADPSQPQQDHSSGSRFSSTSTSFYIHETAIGPISSSENGGAIYLSGGDATTKTVVESCTFTKCVSTNRGGGIYSSSSGHFQQTKNCFFQCNTGDGYFGQSCQIGVGDSPTNNNEITMSSTNQCGSIEGTKQRSLYLLRGKQSISNINISDSHVSSMSGMVLFYAKGISETSFCSFTNNTASNVNCIYLDDNGQYSITFTNIMNNEQKSNSGSLISLSGSLNMNNCSIINNKGEASIFSGSTTNIILNECFIGNNTGNMNSITTQSSRKETFINILSHYGTHLCFSHPISISQTIAITPDLIKAVLCFSRYYPLSSAQFLTLLFFISK